MKFYTPIIIVLFAISLIILQFSACLSPVKPDFAPRIKFDGNIKTEGTRNLDTKIIMYVVAVRESPLTYQWYKDNHPIEGASADSFVIDSLTIKHEGIYKCEIGSKSSIVSSNPYRLRIKENKQEALLENNPPEFKDSLPHDSCKIDEGDTLTIKFEAIDENNDGITYKLTKNTLPKPETTVFDTASKTLSWISKQGDKGTYKIVIKTSDGKTAIEKAVDIIIGKVNLNPRITISNVNQDDTVSIYENETLQFTAKISDPNTEDEPIFDEPENMPEGAVFDKSTGKFTYTPKYDVSSDSSNKIFNAITFHATDNAAENPLKTKFVFHIAVRDKKFLITAKSDTGGGIDPSGTINAEPGKDYMFTITPIEGWTIKEVLVNNNHKGMINSYTFKNIQQNNTIKAVFEKKSYTLTISSDDNGKAVPEGEIQLTPDSSIILTVSPNTGNRFEKWEILQGNPEINKISVDTFEVRIKNESTTIKTCFIENDAIIKYIAVGSSHIHYLKYDNTLWAAGNNTYGQLGDGTIRTGR